ncbi:musculin isoform X1 [Nycticebus coucang]|uniref:musculin isoform X1 n=1 Tax=Nycticebus coucang TaxID=9470 RepID=UPI00234E0DB9|nr:musculin isoform X1 [Nycticebus coucang]
MSTGSVSDPEEMELRGLQREYPVPASKRPPLRGTERSYVSPSDNSSAEEEDPDGEDERCALGAAGSAGGCKRKRPRAAGGVGAGGGAGSGGKKLLPPKGSAAECKQSQRNAANARERARMRVLSKAFSRLKTSLPWVPPDTKLSKLDTLRLASSYIAHLRQLLQEDRYENGYVHPVNLGQPPHRLISCFREKSCFQLLFSCGLNGTSASPSFFQLRVWQTWPFVVSGRPDSDTKDVSAASRLCGTTA